MSAIEDGTLPRGTVRERLERLQQERARALREGGPTVSQAVLASAGTPSHAAALCHPKKHSSSVKCRAITFVPSAAARRAMSSARR